MHCHAKHHNFSKSVRFEKLACTVRDSKPLPFLCPALDGDTPGGGRPPDAAAPIRTSERRREAGRQAGRLRRLVDVFGALSVTTDGRLGGDSN
jgi:hypothetical protein